MSTLLQSGPIRAATGGTYMEDGTLAPDFFHNGLPFMDSGALALDFSGVIASVHQGLGFTATGRLVAKTGTVADIQSGARPILSDGTLVIEEAVATHYNGGVGYTATGAVAIASVKP